MQPDYERDGIRLYHADCLEVLPTFADGEFDAVVTDPPYGLNFRGADWDSEIPDWLPSARRVAPVVAFTTAPTTQWDYPRPEWVCCWYREAANSRSQLCGGFNHWTPVLVYGKPKFPVDSKKLHAIQCAQSPGFPHLSPKPIELAEWLVGNCCPEGGTVADPFLGSGTTAIACIRTGRKCVGVESNIHHLLDIAIPRIEAELDGRPWDPRPVDEDCPLFDAGSTELVVIPAEKETL